MSLIARCGVCDREAHADLDPIIEGAVVYCGACALAMRDDEIETLRQQLVGAVDALEFYANPKSWDYIDPTRGTVTTSYPANRDRGERARAALGGQ
jgi:hypothetical protein